MMIKVVCGRSQVGNWSLSTTDLEGRVVGIEWNEE
jgi:hypothetical protein